MTILSTCVPLFFFANGYLFFSKKFDVRKHFRKMLHLIVLTVIWSAINILVLMLINRQPLSLISFTKAVWLTKFGWNNFLWFMGALISIYIFFPLLKTVFDTNRKIFLYFASILLILAFGNTFINFILSAIKTLILHQSTAEPLNYFGIFNPFYDGFYWWTLAYFCLGGIIHHYKEKILTIPVKQRNICAIVTISTSCLLLYLSGILYSHANNVLYDVVWMGNNTIFTLCNVVAIFLLCLNYKSDNHLITTISRNTIGIYFIHWMLIIFSIRYAIQITWLRNLPGSIIYASIILFSSLGLSLLIQKTPIIKHLL